MINKTIVSNGLKKYIAVALSAIAFVPTFITADTNHLTRKVGGENCFVPVYHTDFANPEGGEFVRIADQLYFFKSYIPGCGSVSGSRAVVQSRNTYSNTYSPYVTNSGTNYLTRIIGGENCYIPVFHTDFANPEGGDFVNIDGQLYYFKDYIPGCGGSPSPRSTRTAVSRYTYEQPRVVQQATYNSNTRCW